MDNQFNRTNYYILVFSIWIPIFIFSLINFSLRENFYLIISAPLGMIGETLFSYWWRAFFSKDFWTYSVDTKFNKHTSTLNLIPWSIGGFMFLAFYRVFDIFFPLSLEPLTQVKYNRIGLADSMLLFLVLVFITSMIGYLLKVYYQKDKNHFWLRYTLLCSPILVLVLFLSMYNIKFLGLSIFIGLGAFVAEYVFGKACVWLAYKKLWIYNFYTFDHNHSTLLNILPFVFGGYYFLYMYQLLV